MQFVPTSTDRPDGLVLLAAERTVTVTREEHHQDVLAGRTGRVVVELRPCMITSGKHAGQDGLEVTLDGRRVGELTWLMAQRYRPVVDALVVRGFRVGCEALLREDARGIQVELRLPAEPTATRRPVDEPLAVPTSVVTHAVPRQPTRRPAPYGVPEPEPASSGCDPNYSGCVPIASDVDCESGNGNGPAYVEGPVRIIGKDIYRLDGGGEPGIGCE
jgi:hypothetical protein